MALGPILWVIFSIMDLTLLGLNFYQFLAFSDLESDYLNPYEFSSRVNSVIVLEYMLHGAFCILFLITGHWIIFLVSLPPAYYNLKQYLSRQHLIDVTEVFTVLNAEKKVRHVKLVFYVVFFGLTITSHLATRVSDGNGLSPASNLVITVGVFVAVIYLTNRPVVQYPGIG